MPDLVAHGANVVGRVAGGIADVPILVVAPWKERAGAAAAERDDDIGGQDELVGPPDGDVGGNVDAGFFQLVDTAAHLKAGTLRALAILGPTRAPSLPDVPTIGEATTPGWWDGSMEPAGTAVGIGRGASVTGGGA